MIVYYNGKLMRLRRNGGHRLRETMKDKARMNEPVMQAKRTRRKFDKAFKQRTAEQLEVENIGLRREIDYLRQQRDILKKTLGILSETPSSAFNGSTR
jgi:hypothetical protein